MEYCSLDDAFPAIGPPCADTQPAIVQKMNKKKKTKNGMTAAPPEPVQLDTDPDRQQYTKKEIPQPNKSDTIEGFASLDTINTSKKISFFGEEGEDDFAPYMGPNVKDNFLLEPDFKTIFEEKGLGKAAGIPMRSMSSLNFDNQFRSMGLGVKPPSINVEQPKADVIKKLDVLQARIDDLEKFRRGNEENSQAEITLFVMSGLAFLFLVDLVGRV